MQRLQSAGARYKRPQRRDHSFTRPWRPGADVLRSVLGRLHLRPWAIALGVTVIVLLLDTRWPNPLWAIPAMIGIVTGTEGLLEQRESAVASLNGQHRTWRPESWLAPLLLVVIAAAILPLFKLEGIALTLTVLMILALIAVSIVADYLILGRASGLGDVARVASNLVIYVTVFGLYFGLLSSSLQELPTSTIGVGLSTALLAAVLVRQAEASWAQTLVYSSVVTVSLVEVRWALDFLDLSGPMMAVFLLLVFYLITGIVQNHLRGQMTRGLVAEFASVGAAGFLLLYGLRFWTG